MINIVRLALDSAEQERLFTGFAVSGDSALRGVGRTGIGSLQRAAVANAGLAQAKEREGFSSLIAGRFEEARAAFEAAESASPGFQGVYEIARLLRSRRAQLENPATNSVAKREIDRMIVERYRWGAPRDLLVLLDSLGRGQALGDCVGQLTPG